MMLESARRRSVPLIVATALFMQNLDATVLATSLPQIARDLSVNPIHLKLAVTSYLLALAVFIPASGWVADRFGSRNVFRAAIAVFALGSIGCALSQGLGTLIAARVLQGIGGAMMVPVGRLVILRAIPKSELVGAMAWLTIPALTAPVLGPPLGGFITTYFDWRWIFWINIPVAILGLGLATAYIPDVREPATAKFDVLGFLLVGPGLAMSLTGATVAGLGIVGTPVIAALIVAGSVLLGLYVWHALVHVSPILDLKLLALPTFRTCMTGGLLFRIGAGATPFLLPLLFQEGFGLTPFQSGLMTLATGLGAIAMKTLAETLLGRFGFRLVLLVNAAVSAAFFMVPAAFTPATPWLLVVFLLLVAGFSRSLQFTSLNVLAYADVPPEKLSRATSFAAAQQELAGTVGVSIAALGLEIMQRIDGGAELERHLFPPVFVAVGVLSGLSLWAFSRLTREAGGNLLGRPLSKVPARN